MPSLVSHQLSIIKYVVLKKIIFFLCFDRLIWTWTWLGLKPLWTRTWLGLEPLWTRSWLGLEPLWTWTCLGLDKGGLDYSPTWKTNKCFVKTYVKFLLVVWQSILCHISKHEEMHLISVKARHQRCLKRPYCCIIASHEASQRNDPTVQGRCWPNGVPKQGCIVVPPPLNIMEVKKNFKKNTYHRTKIEL